MKDKVAASISIDHEIQAINIKKEYQDYENLIAAFNSTVLADNHKIIDQMFFFVINKKPRIIPKFLWKLMLRIVIRVEHEYKNDR